MKKSILSYFVLAAMTLCGTTANAQSTTTSSEQSIDWSQYASSISDVANNSLTDRVYLYSVNDKCWINAGGNYGSEGVKCNRGIAFSITSDNNTYSFMSPITKTDAGTTYNCYLGLPWAGNDQVFMDRRVDEDKNVNEVNCTWYVSENSDKSFKIYTISNSTTYYIAFVNEKMVLSSKTSADWYAIKSSTFHKVIKDQKDQTMIDVTGLIRDSRFVRNVDNSSYWIIDMADGATKNVNYSIGFQANYTTNDGDYHGNDTYASHYGTFGCVEIGSTTGSVTQTITDLEPGLYILDAQCFYYGEGESNAYLFANDEKTQLQVLSAKKTESELLTGTWDSSKEYTDEDTDFESLVTKQYRRVKIMNPEGYDTQFQWNTVAAQYLAQCDRYYQEDETRYSTKVYVTVVKDEGEETGTLKIGLQKDGTDGRAFMDNVKLYYCGQNEFGVNYANEDASKVDLKAYPMPHKFNLSRNLEIGEWNAIILPVTLTATQVRNTFGTVGSDECLLSKLTAVKGSTITFEKVDLTTGEEGINAGECYIIKPTAAPDIAFGTEYKFKQTTADGTALEEVKYSKGAVYQIDGVSRAEALTSAKVESNIISGENYDISYTGYYYRPFDEGAPIGSYVLSKGKMYHVQNNPWTGLPGTSWYLTATAHSDQAAPLTISITNGNSTTDILGTVTETTPNEGRAGVYNLSGQRVAAGTSLSGLPKGIYIVGGKKTIVR